MYRISLLISCFALFISAQCQDTKKNRSSDAYVHRPGSMDGTGKYYLGREIAQIMGSAGAAWLDRDEREKEENSSAAIARMPVQKKSVVADIGAGTGYYSFRIAKVASEGKVYAVDVQQEMLDIMAKRKATLNDKAVEIVKGQNKSVNLPSRSIDLAFMVDVYHELEYPKEMLQSIHECLRPDGRLILIEYRGEDPSIPIKPLHKTTVQQLNKELEANGFLLEKQDDFLPIQHFLQYKKKD